MIRIVLIVLQMLYILPYWLVRIFLFDKDSEWKKYNLETRYQLLRSIGQKVAQAGNVKSICTGMENLPEQDGYVLFPNHQGMFDVVLLLASAPKPVAFVLKKELENAFVIGRIVRAMRYLCMDRKDLKQSGKVILETVKRVKSGENFCIFAEGTRSKLGNETLEFKAGAFKAATKAKAPIVPVAIVDSFKVIESGNIKPVTVKLHYLEPIPYEAYQDMTTNELADEVRRRICEKMAQLQA